MSQFCSLSCLFSSSTTELSRNEDGFVPGFIVTRCDFESVPKALSLPESIGQLQELTTLPNTLGQLVWLSELNLGNNVLTELLGKFAKLQGLHHLDLRFNWLTTLPDNIGLLTWVRMVNVDVNRLTRLPQSIVDLQWLQCLHLGWNRLEELPASFGQLV
jgi:Leucine-rich repeat (LRR) protein